MTRIVVLLASCAIVAACSAMPTAPAASSTGATLAGALALADPSLNGTSYQLTSITVDTMSFTNAQGEFSAPYDADTVFRRANLNQYPTDPIHPACRALAESYNNPLLSDSFFATLSAYATERCNGRIVIQFGSLFPNDPIVPPNPVRILSFQPIP